MKIVQTQRTWVFKTMLCTLFAFLFLVQLFSQNEKKAGLYKYTIINVGTNGYGYSITKKNKVYIKQEHIPSIQGLKSFASKGDAEKVAKLVIKKLAVSDNLPTITREELVSLRIKI